MSRDFAENDPSGKRRQILDGALRAFARKGFYNTRISEVASESGVADGTIYLYFKNKDDLLISLFEDTVEWLIQRVTSELATIEGGFQDKFEALIQLYIQLCLEHSDIVEFITVELRQSAKFIKEYENEKFYKYLAILQQLIVSGQEEGRVRRDIDTRITARLLFGALDEVLLSLTLSKASAPQVEKHIRQVCDIFLNGFLY